MLYHIRPLTWGTCTLYPSYIVRLIEDSLNAHGSHECVGDPDTVNIHHVSPSCMHPCLLIWTINVLQHTNPLKWGTCTLYPSYIVRLIDNYLNAHGSCECVGDSDTMNIHGVSSPQMRLHQTTGTPCMMYHNGLSLLTIDSL